MKKVRQKIELFNKYYDKHSLTKHTKDTAIDIHQEVCFLFTGMIVFFRASLEYSKGFLSHHNHSLLIEN